MLRAGRVEGLAPILEHNRWDLISLLALTRVLAEAWQEPGHPEADAHAIARAHRRRGDALAAIRHLHAARETLDRDGLLELARLHRAENDWEAALQIWEPLAAEGCEEALERLAKYHEHVRRNVQAALPYAAALCRFRPDQPEHRQRHARLLHLIRG